MMTVKDLIKPMKLGTYLDAVIIVGDTQYKDTIMSAMHGEFSDCYVESYEIENSVLKIHIYQKDIQILLIDVLSKLDKNTIVQIEYKDTIFLTSSVADLMKYYKIILMQRVLNINLSGSFFRIEITGNTNKKEADDTCLL